MAYPTGSGSERIKTNYFADFDHSADKKLIDGVDLHIYTILSVVFFNSSSTATGINMYIYPSASGSNITYLLNGTATIVPAWSSFVWNDKFSITGTDELVCAASSGGGGDMDAWITYIDQDWT